MADNVQINAVTEAGGQTIATDDIAGVQHELVKVEFGTDGNATMVSSDNPLPVTDKALTDGTQLTQIIDENGNKVTVTSNKLDVNATIATTGLATGAKQDTGNASLASIDAKLNSSIDVDTGLNPLTDAQLRASPVPVSGTVTVDTSLLATAVKQDTGNASLASIDSKLTNPLPISGTVNANTGLAQPLTDTQLRASAIPVSLDISVLATAARQDTGNTSLSSIDTKLTSQATAAKQDTGNSSLSNIDTNLGAKADSVATTDTGTFSLIAFFKRLLSKLTTQLPATLGQTVMTGSLPVTLASDQSALPVTISGNTVDNTILLNTSLSVTGVTTGIATTGYSSITFQLSGAWAATINIEGSNDNSNWNQLVCLNTNELSMQDSISQNGIYQLKTSSKYVRLNVVGLQSGSIVVLFIGRTVQGLSGVDSLSYAMDKANNMPLYVDTGIRADKNGAIVPSDATTPIIWPVYVGSNFGPIIDTTGYQSISIQLATQVNSSNVNIDFQGSNDGTNFISMTGASIAGTNQSASFVTGNTTIYVCSLYIKYFRVRCSVAAGILIATAYLRQQPSNLLGQNLTNFSGTGVSTSAVGSLSSLVVSGPVAAGVAPTANPLVVGGIDTSGLSRRILTDTSGRLINAADQSGTSRLLGVLSPASGAPNLYTLPVQDTASIEGLNIVELLFKLLMEQKITNQYLYELPAILQAGFNTVMNDSTNKTLKYTFQDEPSALRNDPSLFIE